MNKKTIYCRVSTQEQGLSRQLELREWAEQRGFYVAKVYAKMRVDARQTAPPWKKCLRTCRQGNFVTAENIDRLSRLPIKEQAHELTAAGDPIEHAESSDFL